MGTGPSLDLIFVLLAEGINFVTIVNSSLGNLKELPRRALLSKRKLTMPTVPRGNSIRGSKDAGHSALFYNTAADAGAHRSSGTCSR